MLEPRFAPRLAAGILAAAFAVGCGGDDGPAGEPAADGGPAADGATTECAEAEIEVYAEESWYRDRETEFDNPDFPSASWAEERTFVGLLRRDVFDPPPPHRPAIYWLDDVALYAGGIGVDEMLRPYDGARVVVLGRTGEVCAASSGAPDICSDEIWPGTLKRECPPGD